MLTAISRTLPRSTCRLRAQVLALLASHPSIRHPGKRCRKPVGVWFMQRCDSWRNVGRWMVLLAAGFLATPCSGGNWSQFRGDEGTGIAADLRLPSRWSADQILWTVDVPGVGHSSPVIWGNRLFLTSASETGTTRYILC